MAKARDWSAHVFDSKRADSVTCKVALVEECLSEVHALAKSKGEKLLGSIRKLEHLAARLRR